MPFRSITDCTDCNPSVTSKERNIHRVEAHALTQVVDISAPPYDRQRSAKSSRFHVDPEPFEGRAGVFEATIR